MPRTFVHLVLSDDEIERFWRYVTIPSDPDGCWGWLGAFHHQSGYAYFNACGNSRPAHRVSYVVHHGENPPEGLVLDHLCRNRQCVNPEHLEPVTDRENLARGVGLTAQNLSKTTCPKGHEYDEFRYDYRRCSTCRREANRRFNIRRRAAA